MMHRAILPPLDTTICSADEMTRMVEGSFEDAVQVASSRAACFRFLHNGFKRMRILHEWNPTDSPESIIARVDDVHARLVEEASKHMRKIPEERLKNGLKGYLVVRNVIDCVAEDVLRRYRDVAADLCSNGPDVISNLVQDQDWYKWFRFCVLETDLIDDPQVRPHILRSVTQFDEEIIQKITTRYPRAFFETHPSKWDTICRATPEVLLSVPDEKDILIQALKHCKGSRGMFTYMRHFVEDRAFMAEAVLINPYLLEESPLKKNVEFVIELISRVKDEICAYNNPCEDDIPLPWHKTKYLVLAAQAVKLDPEATWNYSQSVVEAALRSTPTLLLDQPTLMNDRRYRRVAVIVVELHWNSLKNTLRDKPMLCSNIKFLRLLIRRMASRDDEYPRKYHNIHSAYMCCNWCIRDRLFHKTEAIFIEMMQNLLPSQCLRGKPNHGCHHMCEGPMRGLEHDALKKIVRAHPVLIQFVKNTNVLGDDAFIMPLLEADPDIYYLLDSTRFESSPYTRLKWGVYRWIDMELAFKRWGANESMSDLFFHTTYSRILWDIWCPTLLKLEKLPVEMLKHIMSFLMFGPGLEYARYTRVLVKLKSGEWVPGKVHKNRHPDYIIKLDSGYKRKIRCRHIKPLNSLQ